MHDVHLVGLVRPRYFASFTEKGLFDDNDPITLYEHDPDDLVSVWRRVDMKTARVFYDALDGKSIAQALQNKAQIPHTRDLVAFEDVALMYQIFLKEKYELIRTYTFFIDRAPYRKNRMLINGRLHDIVMNDLEKRRRGNVSFDEMREFLVYIGISDGYHVGEDLERYIFDMLYNHMRKKHPLFEVVLRELPDIGAWTVRVRTVKDAMDDRPHSASDASTESTDVTHDLVDPDLVRDITAALDRDSSTLYEDIGTLFDTDIESDVALMLELVDSVLIDTVA